MDDLEALLERFAADNRFHGKGPLSVALVVTRAAREKGLPLSEDDFLSPSGGQVKGLGRASVQKILADHGVQRVLAKEGGRTSRGSIDNMRRYVAFLNGLDGLGSADLEHAEKWWVRAVEQFFASDPLKIRLDRSKSLGAVMDELFAAALARQKAGHGVMVTGALMQHLVGAKLEIAMPNTAISHSGFSVADDQTGRSGDFIVGDTVIHVTSAPSPGLLLKCRENLEANLKPLIITSALGSGGAKALADVEGIGERVDILELGQFLTGNIYEWTGFQQEYRADSMRTLIDAYNRIIERCETDPSLRIELE